LRRLNDSPFRVWQLPFSALLCRVATSVPRCSPYAAAAGSDAASPGHIFRRLMVAVCVVCCARRMLEQCSTLVTSRGWNSARVPENFPTEKRCLDVWMWPQGSFVSFA
jgi:hypothetical protein